MVCPSPEFLVNWSEGRRDVAEQQAFREHLDTCSSCWTILVDLERARSINGLSGSAPHPFTNPGESRPTPIARGTVVGRYVLLDPIGSGGMGVVYAAYDPELDRKIAIKLLSATARSSNGQALLLREAQAMAKLSHPNVLAVYDVGTFESERVFLAMELVAGSTAKQWTAQAPRSWRQVLEVYQAAASGLAAAHAAGLVHHDFKPDNVLVGTDRRIRVTDFGLARVTTPEESAGQMPSPPRGGGGGGESSRLRGTPAYMAPEQYLAQPADARSDQFSFGVSLYEALYGQRPHEGSYVQRPAAERWAVRAPPPDVAVPGWLRAVVLRCLNESPERRYATIDELIAALNYRPRARLYRWAPWAAVALGVAGLFAGFHRVREQSGVCRGAEKELALAWGDQEKGRIRQAFLNTGNPRAAEAWTHAAAALDAYARGWVSMRTEACEATRIRGEQSDEVLSLRMECLDRRHEELAALSRVLALADTAVVDRAAQAAMGLEPIEGCRDVPALREGRRPPSEPSRRREFDALSLQLADGRANFLAGKTVETQAIAARVLKQAQALNDPLLKVEALGLLGDAEASAGDPHAPQTLLDAAWAALGTRQDARAARNLIRLVLAESNFVHLQEAERWLPLADQLVERLGRPTDLDAQYLHAHAAILMRTGRSEQSVAEYQRVLRLLDQVGPSADATRAAAYSGLSVPLGDLGRPTEGAAAARQGLEICERLYGTVHPYTGGALLNLALSLKDMHQYVEALKYAERARDVLGQVSGRTSIIYAVNLSTLAESLSATGRYAEAEAAFGESVRTIESKLGSESYRLAEPVLGWALTERRERHWSEALALNRRALAVATKAMGPGDPEAARALVGIGEVELAEGGRAPDVASLERALRILEAEKREDELARARFALARALGALRRDPPRVQQLASDARASFLKVNLPEWAEEVVQWCAASGRCR